MQPEKGKPCISIILPTHRLSPDRRTDEMRVKKAVQRAAEHLIVTYPEEAEKLISNLNSLASQIDYNHNQEGLGLFATGSQFLQVLFPFQVKEKIIVGESFEVRDVLFKSQFAQPYFVLHLDEKRARLFSGSLMELTEVKDNNFPSLFEDDYIYSPPSRGSSFTGNAFLKSFEDDKAAVKKERFDAFLLKTDELLNDYIKDLSTIIVCGIKRNTSAFLNRTSHAEQLVSVINGNYDWLQEEELASIVWPAVKANMDKKMKEEISDFIEKIGEGQTEEGIVSAWMAVSEGRGRTLLVEKDYRIPGFLVKGSEYELHLHPPKKPHQVLADAVDDLVEKQLSQKGRVVFVDDGMLQDHQHLVLITRY